MRRRPYDIVTIGDTCVDLIVDMGQVTPRFGQVEQLVPDYDLEMGGSNCLFACQAAKLGLSVAVLACVGDDPFGQLVLRRLRESGVDTSYVRVRSDLKTGLSLALTRSGDRSILTYSGTLSAVGPDDVSDRFLQSGRHFHLGSYYLLANLRGAFPAILERAQGYGLTISVDTNWDPDETWADGLEGILAQADLFFPNEQEALAITATPDLDQALSLLAEKVPVVAVKLGPRGALLVQPGQRTHFPIEPVASPMDTIGAGDAFDAGFLAGWLRERPLAECVAIGNVCGRATLRAKGGLRGQLGLRDVQERVGLELAQGGRDSG